MSESELKERLDKFQEELTEIKNILLDIQKSRKMDDFHKFLDRHVYFDRNRYADRDCTASVDSETMNQLIREFSSSDNIGKYIDCLNEEYSVCEYDDKYYGMGWK